MNKFICFQEYSFLKRAPFFLLLLFFATINIPSVFAGDWFSGDDIPSDPFAPTSLSYPTPTIGESSGIFEILGNIFGFFYYLFFAIAAFMFLYAGFLYLTAADDTDKINKAGKILIYGFIAVVVAVVSVGLAAVLAGIVTGN